MVFHGQYVGQNRILIAPVYGGKLLCPADDLSITPSLLLDGCFERGMTNYVRRSVRPGMTIIDVGANIGYFTVLFGMQVGSSGKVYAYEPAPAIFQWLLDNLALNGLGNTALAHQVAMSDATGFADLAITSRFQGNSSIMPHPDSYNSMFPSDTITRERVATITLDELGLTHVDLVKIDVEGAECRVLDGMSEMLDKGRVDVVTFEWNRAMLQADCESLVAALRSRQDAYRLALLDDRGRTRWTSVDEVIEHDFIANVLMIRRRR